MFIHPEISRVIAAQRNQEIRANAEASRQIADARAARTTNRSRTARFRWPRPATARRPAVAYSSGQDA